MTVRKRTTSKTTKPVRRRKPVASSRTKRNVFNFFVPLVFIVAMLCALGFLLFKGYQTVTASSIFDMRKLEIRGNSRVAREDIERIIRMQTERNGVWNSELEQIKGDVEKLNFVRSAVVTRVLPDGILVRLEERIPRAVVRTNSGDSWVDDDGRSVGTVGKNDVRPPFLLVGWNEENSEKAQKDNKERVKLFLKIQEDIKSVGSVKSIDLNDLQDAKVYVEYQDKSIEVRLGTEDFLRRLQKALEVIEGKNGDVKTLTSHGGLPTGK